MPRFLRSVMEDLALPPTFHPRAHAVWLECLIETARWFDPRIDERVEQARRTVFHEGIQFIISKYDQNQIEDAPKRSYQDCPRKGCDGSSSRF